MKCLSFWNVVWIHGLIVDVPDHLFDGKEVSRRLVVGFFDLVGHVSNICLDLIQKLIIGIVV